MPINLSRVKKLEDQVKTDLEKQCRDLRQEWVDTLSEEEFKTYADVANWLMGQSHKRPNMKTIREACRVRRTAPYELIEANRRLWNMYLKPEERIEES